MNPFSRFLAHRKPQPPEGQPVFGWHDYIHTMQRQQPLRWWQYPLAWFQRYLRRPTLCARCVDFGANRGHPKQFCISPRHLCDARCAAKINAIQTNHAVAIMDDFFRLQRAIWNEHKRSHEGGPGEEWKDPKGGLDGQ